MGARQLARSASPNGRRGRAWHHVPFAQHLSGQPRSASFAALGMRSNLIGGCFHSMPDKNPLLPALRGLGTHFMFVYPRCTSFSFESCRALSPTAVESSKLMPYGMPARRVEGCTQTSASLGLGQYRSARSRSVFVVR